MKIYYYIFVLLLFFQFISCSTQSSGKETSVVSGNSDRIDAYYFHFTLRCEACLNIEARAKESLESLYPDYLSSGLITFQALNLDEAPNRELAKKFGVSGQALILVKGDQKIDLTNEGFLYATVKPEKFREIINEKVAGLLIK
ncbi:MAG: hypothetical protein HPY62_09560 [Bacteroidales bacterium]|nr:hypothetical protein [Bacteroidales bacterium]